VAIKRIRSHYHREKPTPENDFCAPVLSRVGSDWGGNEDMATNSKMKLGVLIVASVLAGMTTFWLSLPLLTIAAGLIALAQEPKGTEAFFSNIPYGNNVLAFLEKVDAFLSA
jgi:hypothetical protein